MQALTLVTKGRHRGQVTNYNCVLRTNSSTYFLPGLAVHGPREGLFTALRL